MKISGQLEKGISIFERFFYCPGCKCAHGFRSSEWPEPKGLNDEQKKFFINKWIWDGNMESPTFSPSFNVLKQVGVNKKNEPVYETTCHSIIRAGKIEFLNDCKHELKGQTVDMVDMEDI